MAFQLQTPALPWQAPLQMGWPINGYFIISTWCSCVEGPKGWQHFQGEWSKTKALHSESRAKYKRGICQVDRSHLFVLKCNEPLWGHLSSPESQTPLSNPVVLMPLRGKLCLFYFSVFLYFLCFSLLVLFLCSFVLLSYFYF
jgi:hypothetical protein